MNKIIYRELSYQVQGIIYDVYNKLGPVWNEEIYEKAMIIGLRNMNLKAETQKQLQISYKDQIIGLYRPDIIVENKIILELKAMPEITPLNQAQIISYLKATNLKLGILINFGSPKIYFKRYAYESANIKVVPINNYSLSPNLLYTKLTKIIINTLLEAHSILGPGFCHYIYRRAVWREFRLRDIPFLLVKEMTAKYQGLILGKKEIKLFIIDQKILVWILAVKEINEIHEDKIRKYLKHFNLKLGIISNFNNKLLAWRFVRTNSRLS